MVGIYRVVNNIDGKCYVGQSTNIEKRWGEHRRGSNYHKHDGFHLYEAIRKYGLYNFKFEVIEECDVSVLDEREKYWIDFFNSCENGYNMNTGGRKISENDQKIIYDLWNEGYSIGEIADHVICSYVSVARFVRSSEWYDKEESARRSKAWHRKPVFQYRIDGTFLREFLSIDDAGRETGVRPDTISACCNKRCSKSAGGYQWSFEKLEKLDPYNPYEKPREQRKVLQFTKSGELIGRYDSITDAHKKTGVSRSSISPTCHNIQEYGKGFIWRFEVMKNGKEQVY